MQPLVSGRLFLLLPFCLNPLTGEQPGGGVDAAGYSSGFNPGLRPSVGSPLKPSRGRVALKLPRVGLLGGLLLSRLLRGLALLF